MTVGRYTAVRYNSAIAFHKRNAMGFMGFDAKSGLVTRSVDTGSFAEDVGLFEKDVILSINRQPVATAEDVIKIQSTLKAGDAVALRIMRPVAAGRAAAPQWTTFFVSSSLSPQ